MRMLYIKVNNAAKLWAKYIECNRLKKEMQERIIGEKAKEALYII